MLVDLSSRNALVTGAGSGIGAACAQWLAESGAFVWVNDLNGSAAWAKAEEILEAGYNACAAPGDVAEPDAWLGPVLDGGPLHVIVHNAGYDLSTPVGKTARSDFEQLHRVMVSGPFEITQQLLPCLRLANGAAVIFIASVHALCTEPAISAYAAAKAGQIGMMRSMAQDLGQDKIRVLSVSPGYVDTAIWAQWLERADDAEALQRHTDGLHPMGRIGKPADIAALVTFLASPLAEFVNGTNVVIDGALTAQLMH